ncbi:hypothetical protein [Sediminibacillus massiliensis]|uniref:hypothetical protein n=1 Tax=Sediminibacillus massiliensis TaxID=1926277 RepID=UPI0015C34C1C|nr:hypothetical protein [Sediminibacillus massiliensis]
MNQPKKTEKQTHSLLKDERDTGELFEGMSFKYPPVSKEDYINAYEEYVRRCSS